MKEGFSKISFVIYSGFVEVCTGSCIDFVIVSSGFLFGKTIVSH